MPKPSLKSRHDFLRDESFLNTCLPEIDGEPIALVYPNEYKVGMASLGFLTAYRFLIHAGFKPQRFFFDVRDKRNNPISVETGTKLRSFEKIAFHFSYEPDYVNAISMLIDSQINTSRIERQKSGGHFIIGGGIAVTANPLPLVDFLDVFFIGEIEGTVLEVLRGSELFSDSDIFSHDGWFLSDTYINELTDYKVRQRFSDEWDKYLSFSPVVTPNTVFREINLVEIARGCPIKCAFCLGGNLYGKPRERKADSIIESAMVHGENVKKIGLIASIPSLHSSIEKVIGELTENGKIVTLSSISVTSLNEKLISLLSKSGMKTLTLGVESFDEKLQHSYGKVIGFERLIDGVSIALKFGFREAKIYLMLGLPGARDDEDLLIVERLIVLNAEMQKVRKGSKLTVSLNPFIPKVATYYEKESFMGEKAFRDRMRKINGPCEKRGIHVTIESHRRLHLQNLLSRGDEKTGLVILSMARGENWKKKSMELFSDEEAYLRKSVEKIGKIISRKYSIDD